MKSFDEFGFEKKSNITDKSENNLADDFITRRKKTAAPEVQSQSESKETALTDKQSEGKELSLVEAQGEMTVMSIKGSDSRVINKPATPRKNIFATDNVLEKKKKKLPVRTVVVLAFVFALSFLIINQYVLITEYSKGIAGMKNTIKGLENDLEQCETELVIKNKNVIEQAKENGMVSDKDGHSEYIEIPVSDTVELHETKESEQESLTSIIMSALGENILHAWNTLTGAE